MNKGILGISGLMKGTDSRRVLFAAIASPTTTSTSSNTYTDIAPAGPSLIVPETGLWIIDWGCSYARTNTSGTSAHISITINGRLYNIDKPSVDAVQPPNLLIGSGYDPKNPILPGTYDEEAAYNVSGAASNGCSISSQIRKYLRAGDVIQLKYRASGGTAVYSRNIWLKLTRVN